MKVRNIVFSGFAAAILMSSAQAAGGFQIASKAYVDPGAGNYVAADKTAGENVKALDSQLKSTTDTANAAVPRQMNGGNGKALIFNENDGGGAKFENTDGTNSFTGVNDGGKDGIAAQIYAVDKDTKVGSRIDINPNGMYYTVGNATPAQRMVDANKIATKGDITAAVNNAMGGSVGDITELHDGNDSNFSDPQDVVGALNNLDDAINTKQDKADSTVADGSYNYIQQGNGVADNLVALDTATKAAKDKADAAVEKQIVTGNNKALIFNESDGGGAKFEHGDGTWSFTGVNEGGANGLAAQIYAVDKTSKEGARIDVYKGGMYYTVGNDDMATRHNAANEIATKGDIAAVGGNVGNMANLNNTANDNFGAETDTVVEALNDLDNAINTKQDFADSTAAAGNYIAAGNAVGSNLEALDTQLKTTTDTANAAVPRQMNGGSGKALIFNENDGGGAKFEHTDGTNSFTGVNDGGKDGIAAQIYAVNKDTKIGSRIDINPNGMYYTVGNATPAQRMVEANKIATLGDIDNGVGAKVGSGQLSNFSNNVTNLTEAVNDLQTGKANIGDVYTKADMDTLLGAKLNKPIENTCGENSLHCVLHMSMENGEPELSWVDVTVPFEIGD